MDACPRKAIDFAFVGERSRRNSILHPWMGPDAGLLRRVLLAPLVVLEELLEARTLFVFSGLLFGAILSGTFVPEAMLRLYRLACTGSLLLR